MLVSAIETAALEWSSDSTPNQQLELAFPDLAKLIQSAYSARPGKTGHHRCDAEASVRQQQGME